MKWITPGTVRHVPDHIIAAMLSAAVVLIPLLVTVSVRMGRSEQRLDHLTKLVEDMAQALKELRHEVERETRETAKELTGRIEETRERLASVETDVRLLKQASRQEGGR